MLSLWVIATIVIVAIQHYLSSNEHWQMGGIMPVLCITLGVFVKLYIKPSINITSFLILTILLVVIWIEKRGILKKRNSQKKKTITT